MTATPMTEVDTERLAALALEYSLQLQPGDLLRIRGEAAGLSLMQAAHRRAVALGAQPFVDVSSPEEEAVRLRQASDEELDFVSATEMEKIERIQADLWVIADVPPDYSGIAPERLARWQRARGKLDERWAERTGDTENRLRWCAVLYPSATLAAAAGKTTEEFADLARHALLLDKPDPAAAWQERVEWQRTLSYYLAEKEQFRVVAEGTDLTFQTAGRGWLNGNGRLNLPDGEVCTSPIEDSVNGPLQITYPVFHQGRAIHDARLTFQNGQVVAWDASQGKDALTALLQTDPGARRLGEFAIATNDAVTAFTGCILVDEKMGGTCHFALGRSIPGTGGINNSALHVDMVLDLKQGGRIYADKKRIYENGRFVVDITANRQPFWQRWLNRS